MLDPMILDAMAEMNISFAFSYREHLPEKIFNLTRDLANALYKEALKQNIEYDELLGIKKINRCED